MAPTDKSSGSGGDATSRDKTPALDAILDALSHQYRRILLEYLITRRHSVVTVEDATTFMQRTLRERQGTAPPRDEITLELHHRHLPTLEAANVIGYDPDRQTIEYEYNKNLERVHNCLHDLDFERE